MTLKQLQYLVTIVDSGSFSSAAEKLHISQPPLSMQIKLLEDELGQPLFERSTRYIRPTDACLKLYEKARSILSLVDEARGEILTENDQLSEKLVIGSISSCGGVFLGQRLTAFIHAYPGISYDLIEGNTFVLLEKLKKHEIDLAFVRTPYDKEGLTCHSLVSEPMCAVSSTALLPEGQAISTGELSQYPLIVYRRFEPMLRKLFRQQDLPFHVRCLNDDARTTLMWAQSGMGCAIVPKSIADFLAKPGITIREIREPGLVTQVELVHRKGQYLSPAARKFIEAYR